jgi:hypothetical protein
MSAIPNPQQALSSWPNLPPSRTPRDLLWSRHGDHSLPPLRRDVATHGQNADAVRRAPALRSLLLALSSRPRRRLHCVPSTARTTVTHPCRSTKGGCVKCLPLHPAPNAIRLSHLDWRVKRSSLPTKRCGRLGRHGTHGRCVHQLADARTLRTKTGGEFSGLPENAPPVVIRIRCPAN